MALTITIPETKLRQIVQSWRDQEFIQAREEFYRPLSADPELLRAMEGMGIFTRKHSADIFDTIDAYKKGREIETTLFQEDKPNILLIASFYRFLEKLTDTANKYSESDLKSDLEEIIETCSKSLGDLHGRRTGETEEIVPKKTEERIVELLGALFPRIDAAGQVWVRPYFKKEFDDLMAVIKDILMHESQSATSQIPRLYKIAFIYSQFFEKYEPVKLKDALACDPIAKVYLSELVSLLKPAVEQIREVKAVYDLFKLRELGEYMAIIQRGYSDIALTAYRLAVDDADGMTAPFKRRMPVLTVRNAMKDHAFRDLVYKEAFGTVERAFEFEQAMVRYFNAVLPITDPLTEADTIITRKLEDYRREKAKKRLVA